MKLHRNNTDTAAHRYRSDTSLIMKLRPGLQKATKAYSISEIMVGVIFPNFRRESGCTQVELWQQNYIP